MRCVHCGNETPEGPYCTRCGAAQQTTAEAGHPGRRLHSYAAHPGEHVLHPSPFTTLLPHLGKHKIHEYRWVFVAGAAALVALVVAGLIGTAILFATLLVPLLYIMYLYEAQVYRDEPILVLGLAFVGGIILGWLVTYIADNVVSTFGSVNLVGSADTTTLIGLGVIVPLISEVVKPLPIIPLRFRPKFGETVDGLVFGIAAGLGFALAEGMVHYWSIVRDTPFHDDPANWIYPLVSLAILRPVMQGSTTGLIAAAVWRLARRRLGVLEVAGIALAIAAHIGFVLVSDLLTNGGFSQLIVLAWQALIVAVLLIAIRYVLHNSLLEEAAHMGFREVVCPNCHRHIVASGFCPQCGKALTSAPAVVRDTAIGSPASLTEGS